MFSIVKGNVDAEFSSSEEEIWLFGVLTDGVDEGGCDHAGSDRLPGFTVVTGAVKIGVLVVHAMAFHGGVGDSRIEVGRIDERDAAPGLSFGLHCGRRDVGPGPSAIAGDRNDSGVTSGPEDILVHIRRRNGGERAVTASDGAGGRWGVLAIAQGGAGGWIAAGCDCFCMCRCCGGTG